VDVAGEARLAAIAQDQARLEFLAHGRGQGQRLDRHVAAAGAPEAHQVDSADGRGVLVLLAARDTEQAAEVAGIARQSLPVGRRPHVGVHEGEPRHAERGGRPQAGAGRQVEAVRDTQPVAVVAVVAVAAMSRVAPHLAGDVPRDGDVEHGAALAAREGRDVAPAPGKVDAQRRAAFDLHG